MKKALCQGYMWYIESFSRRHMKTAGIARTVTSLLSVPCAGLRDGQLHDHADVTIHS